VSPHGREVEQLHGIQQQHTLDLNLYLRANKLGSVVHACNPSTGEARAEGSGFPGQPGLCRETHLKRTTKQMKTKELRLSLSCGGRGLRLRFSCYQLHFCTLALQPRFPSLLKHRRETAGRHCGHDDHFHNRVFQLLHPCTTKRTAAGPGPGVTPICKDTIPRVKRQPAEQGSLVFDVPTSQ
jgi:hypothetical protein